MALQGWRCCPSLRLRACSQLRQTPAHTSHPGSRSCRHAPVVFGTAASPGAKMCMVWLALLICKLTKSCCLTLQAGRPFLGDVRGLGLMLGIECVSDGTLAHAPKVAHWIKVRALL